MRKGINFAQLPATFLRKVSKENISNNCYHASKDIDMFMQIKSVKGNIEGKSENLDLTYIGLIYILVSYRMSFCLKLHQESFTAFKHRDLPARVVVYKTAWFWPPENTSPRLYNVFTCADIWPFCSESVASVYNIHAEFGLDCNLNLMSRVLSTSRQTIRCT